MAPKKTPILFNFLALVSLVALHCAKTGPFLKGLAQIILKLLQYPRDLVGPLMNLKKSDLKRLDFHEQNREIRKSEIR